MAKPIYRQARCQFTNIRMHPERYRPRPPAVVERTYAFYHKAETPMSVPVRRTVYASDCYKRAGILCGILSKSRESL